MSDQAEAPFPGDTREMCHWEQQQFIESLWQFCTSSTIPANSSDQQALQAAVKGLRVHVGSCTGGRGRKVHGEEHQ